MRSHMFLTAAIVLALGCDCPDLVGSGLPESHDECKEAGGWVHNSISGTLCTLDYNEDDDAALFEACLENGGGELACGMSISGEACGRSCKINYPEDGCPCGNACD
jgi:hypothetical protein